MITIDVFVHDKIYAHIQCTQIEEYTRKGNLCLEFYSLGVLYKYCGNNFLYRIIDKPDRQS